MTLEQAVKEVSSFPRDLKIVKELVYDRCGIFLTNPKVSTESAEYGACSFELNGKFVQHRVSKITPTKVGQFVTIWKRSGEGVTEPFDGSDDIDFIVITVRMGSNFGQFIFPKLLLIEKGIVTHNGRNGKRGMRVYPPWDIVTNKQAVKTQSWQTQYFFEIKNDYSTDLDWVRQSFS